MLNRCGKTGQGAQGHVFHMLRTVGQDGAGRLALVRRVLQKLAMSSAEARPPTCLLQKASKASFRALWNSELLLKLSVTYCACICTSVKLLSEAGATLWWILGRR